MFTTEILTLAGSMLQKDPFLHVVVPNCMGEDLAKSLLTWFEEEADWQFSAIDEFYHLLDIDLRKVRLPESLKILVEDSFLEDLRDKVAGLVNAQLASKIDVTAHKMIPG